MNIIRSSFVLIVNLAVASTVLAQTPTPVRTQAGLVQGEIENSVTVYKGIPFAAPPLGDLRWRAPQPPLAWTGVRTANKFAPSCLQPSSVVPAGPRPPDGRRPPEMLAPTETSASIR
jgi:para-nitrobenzyl esterase